MTKRTELVNFLNNYFEPYGELARTREMLINGLQITGYDEINKVGLGVSASLEFFQKAYQQGCNFLIVHHGLGFLGIDKTNKFTPHMEERLRFLFTNNISLSGYHFMLDNHPEIGNNAWVIKKLGAEVIGNVYDKWGWFGRFSEPKSFGQIIKGCETIYSHKSNVVGLQKDKIAVFAVVSGSGAVDYKSLSSISEFIENKIELEIVGDMKESHPAFAKELGLSIAAFGHYNTETIGVKNLGDVIKKEFPTLAVEFVDVPNEL